MRSVFYSRCYTKIIYYYGFIVVIYDVINGVASCRITFGPWWKPLLVPDKFAAEGDRVAEFIVRGGF